MKYVIGTTTTTLEQRIANAHLALSNVKGEWGKNYWTTVIAALLRKANRLN